MKTQANSHLIRIEEIRQWLSVDHTGGAHVFEAGERDIMRRTGSTLYDVRRILGNDLFSFPSTYSPVFGRGRAIIMNVEPIQVFITADEVILRDPSSDTPFVQGLQARIRNHNTITTPFELVVLEACLEASCSVLENEAKMLEQKAHTPSLYKFMSRLIDITNRVQIVREGLARFLFDESNMATYSTANDKFVVKELKMLLEAYYFQILSILNKLSKVSFYFLFPCAISISATTYNFVLLMFLSDMVIICDSLTESNY
jgi:hypothetical protein